MSKIWKLPTEIPAELSEQFKIYPKIVRQLLYNRDITDPAEADIFLHPEYNKLHDPYLFQDMEKAVERVWKAIKDNEKICVYGDYDADAVTANAVLQQTFKHLGADISSYIPDRFTEGYGLNLEAFSKIKDQGVTLVITVDCGTNSVDAAEFCAANGIDLIITDHHEIIGPTPEAFALINPKNPNDKYPYHEITGVGVAFKLASAILNSPLGTDHVQPPVPGWEKWLLDLVATGTVADCHSLQGENRILVKFGLQVLAKTKWIGMKALCDVAGVDPLKNPLDTYTLGFIIAPRLNAAGRLEHADIALNLMTETDPDKARAQAERLESINVKRQEVTARIMSEAREQAELMSDRKVLVLLGEDWPKGVVGLAAGKIAEEFYKPTIVLEKGTVESTGSARTVGDFNVVEALKHASEFLLKFGGHKQAAGLTLKTEHYDIFYQRILEYAELHLTASDRTLSLEGELEHTEIQLTTYKHIENFAPFGVDNQKPKFLVRTLKITSMKLVGKTAQHMQLNFEMGARKISGILFNATDYAKNLNVDDVVDVACELLEDNWNGRSGVKLRVVDVRPSETV